jgi:tRNA threonylcarbamoyladenosine biosynthesis protein TsaE
MELIFTLEEIDAAAIQLLSLFPGARVFAFHGQMGAGKTTFITAVCKNLGVNTGISSPTFSIINEYEAGGKRIYHLDLYRLKGAAEAIDAGVEDVLYSGDICLVEWPEVAPELFPEGSIHVFLRLLDAGRRILSLTGPG